MKKKLIAEMIGTMVLVLMGCGSAVFTGGFSVLTIAVAFGLSLVAMAYTIGSISGCHINPAVTFAFWLNKRMSGKEAISYIGAQIIGAILGSLVLFLIASNMGIDKMGANVFAEGNMFAAFFAEVIFTCIFVLVVLATTDKYTKSPALAGLIIGLTLMLVHIVCIPITGTSVNPARSIAPALFQGGKSIEQLWLFIIAPLIGGGLSSFVWNMLKRE
ncbi:MAG: MIP family channel protein [Bacteroidetes bacterium]|nr:MIP family channel protein [Bacteroidota bacterium]